MDELFKDMKEEQKQIADCYYQKATEAKGWASEPICGTSFATHTYPGGYQIHFDTDSEEAYEAVQKKIRDIMGHGKPKTKGDQIRDMTDEELAFYMRMRGCPTDEINNICKNNRIKEKSCTRCWLDWLKSPAEKALEG